MAIGNFDGVHLGHRALLEAMTRQATAAGTHPTVLTFSPHPARVLAPRFAPPLICLPAFDDDADGDVDLRDYAALIRDMTGGTL